MVDGNVKLVRSELADALRIAVPSKDERAEAVEWLFQSDPRAPYVLALHTLTGATVPEELASGVWRSAIEIQHHWSRRLKEAVSIKAAASEALARGFAGSAAETDAEKPDSLRAYLQRDLVTGLQDRSHFNARLSEEVEGVARTGQPVSLLLIALSGLQAANASRGGEDRDEILRSLGELARHHFRHTDIPCRYGENELAVILPATTPETALALGREFLGLLHQMNSEWTVKTFAGAASCSSSASDAKTLERAAMKALRQARASSAGSVILASQKSRQKARPVTTESGGWEGRFRVGLAVGLAVGVIAEAGVGLVCLPHLGHSSQFLGNPFRSGAHTSSVPGTATTPESTRGAAGGPFVMAADSPSEPGGLSAVDVAALPRIRGNDALAASQLQVLAATSKDPDERVRARIAAACALGAAGSPPLPWLNQAAHDAKGVSGNEGYKLAAMVNLSRGLWYNAHHQDVAALNSFKSAWNESPDPSLRVQAAMQLIRLDQATGHVQAAQAVASIMAGAASSPEIAAGFRILEADAAGNSAQVLEDCAMQPGALAATGGELGTSVVEAAGRAIVPASAAARAGWQQRLQPVLVLHGVRTATRLKVQMVVARRLLEAGDYGNSHRILATMIDNSGGSDAAHLSGSSHQQALVLDGVAQWNGGNHAAAMHEWKLAEAPLKDTRREPAVFLPTPEEQWWTRTAGALAGAEDTSHYFKFLALESPDRAKEGMGFAHVVGEVGNAVKNGANG